MLRFSGKVGLLSPFELGFADRANVPSNQRLQNPPRSVMVDAALNFTRSSKETPSFYSPSLGLIAEDRARPAAHWQSWPSPSCNGNLLPLRLICANAPGDAAPSFFPLWAGRGDRMPRSLRLGRVLRSIDRA